MCRKHEPRQSSTTDRSILYGFFRIPRIIVVCVYFHNLWKIEIFMQLFSQAKNQLMQALSIKSTLCERVALPPYSSVYRVVSYIPAVVLTSRFSAENLSIKQLISHGSFQTHHQSMALQSLNFWNLLVRLGKILCAATCSHSQNTTKDLYP